MSMLLSYLNYEPTSRLIFAVSHTYVVIKIDLCMDVNCLYQLKLKSLVSQESVYV